MNYQTFQLQKVTLTELSEITQLACTTFEETEHGFGVVPQEDLDAYLQAHFEPKKMKEKLEDENVQYYLIRNEKEKIIAYFKLVGNRKPEGVYESIEGKQVVNLERMYVLQEETGRGVGTFMIKKALELAQTANFEGIWLSVWGENASAIRFYKRWGFEKIGERIFRIHDKDYFDDVMFLTLTNQ